MRLSAVFAFLAVFSAGPRAFADGALELQTGWAWSKDDVLVDHSGPTCALRWWLRDVLAVGVRGTFYAYNSGHRDFVGRFANRVTLPRVEEYQWQSQLTVTYVFARAHRSLVHFDAYALAGVGVLVARPIAVIDPDNRNFGFRPSATFGGGVGSRIFVGRWFATSLEIRDFAWSARSENVSITSDPTDRNSWYGPAHVMNDVEFQLAISLVAPL